MKKMIHRIREVFENHIPDMALISESYTNDENKIDIGFFFYQIHRMQEDIILTERCWKHFHLT